MCTEAVATLEVGVGFRHRNGDVDTAEVRKNGQRILIERDVDAAVIIAEYWAGERQSAASSSEVSRCLRSSSASDNQQRRASKGSQCSCEVSRRESSACRSGAPGWHCQKPASLQAVAHEREGSQRREFRLQMVAAAGKKKEPKAAWTSRQERAWCRRSRWSRFRRAKLEDRNERHIGSQKKTATAPRQG